jgi:hypothetical protein
MHQEREWFNRQLREYEAAHGFTPVVTRPSRIDEVRTRGRDLNTELEKGSTDKDHTATSTVPKVIYSSPVKNLRAAAEVAKDLSNLSGEALREHQARLTIFCLKLPSSRRPSRRQTQVPGHPSTLCRKEVPAQGRGGGFVPASKRPACRKCDLWPPGQADPGV